MTTAPADLSEGDLLDQVDAAAAAPSWRPSAALLRLVAEFARQHDAGTVDPIAGPAPRTRTRGPPRWRGHPAGRRVRPRRPRRPDGALRLRRRPAGRRRPRPAAPPPAAVGAGAGTRGRRRPRPLRRPQDPPPHRRGSSLRGRPDRALRGRAGLLDPVRDPPRGRDHRRRPRDRRRPRTRRRPGDLRQSHPLHRARHARVLRPRRLRHHRPHRCHRRLPRPGPARPWATPPASTNAAPKPC